MRSKIEVITTVNALINSHKLGYLFTFGPITTIDHDDADTQRKSRFYLFIMIAFKLFYFFINV